MRQTTCLGRIVFTCLEEDKRNLENVVVVNGESRKFGRLKLEEKSAPCDL